MKLGTILNEIKIKRLPIKTQNWRRGGMMYNFYRSTWVLKNDTYSLEWWVDFNDLNIFKNEVHYREINNISNLKQAEQAFLNSDIF